MSTITTKEGTEIYYKDWGQGPVITFSHGWPLNSDAWDGQMLFLASPLTNMKRDTPQGSRNAAVHNGSARSTGGRRSRLLHASLRAFSS